MSESIKYKYALDNNHQIVDVENLSESDRKDFICISCENTLRPVLGKIKRKHFRHQYTCECSGETYLHRLGKLIFKQNYENCLKANIPFKIVIPRQLACNKCRFEGPCEVGYGEMEYDLTRGFRSLIEETRDDKFVPDILLIGPKDKKVYVEIAVTHESTSEKISSGFPIIEYFISCEDDLDYLRSSRVCMSEAPVMLYNFKVEAEMGDYHTSCNKNRACFVLWKTGKAFIGMVPGYKIDSLKTNSAVEIIQEVVHWDHRVFIECIEKSHNDGHLVKNCYLCRYHTGANNNYSFNDGPCKKGPIFCKFLQKTYFSNDAAGCQYYKIDTEVFGTERYEERKWYRSKHRRW